jgi:hypothetical protein
MRPQRRRGTTALIALTITLATSAADGCSARHSDGGDSVTSRDSLLSATPDIVGIVTAVDSARIRVEENPNDRSGSAKASVRVTSETRILRRSGGSASLADIKVGARVGVWFSGPVMESYPVQGSAGAVILQ